MQWIALFLLSYAQAQEAFESLPWAISTDREIVLADARLFTPDLYYCEYMVWIASRHAERFREEVKTWNNPDKFAAWEKECLWRKDCWRTLARAKRSNKVYVSTINGERWIDNSWDRLNGLYELRELLGRDAFYLGAMPSPIPQYTILPNR